MSELLLSIPPSSPGRDSNDNPNVDQPTAVTTDTNPTTTTVITETVNDQSTELHDDDNVLPSIKPSNGNSHGNNNNHNNNSGNGTNDDGCVQVAVRVRPMLPHEAGTTECVDVMQTAAAAAAATTTDTNNSDNNHQYQVCDVIRLGGPEGPKFTFDQVFGANTIQSQVYDDKVAPLVANCLEGYNATVLAYGQTGSGKTHTIMGPSTSITTALLEAEERQQAGVIPRAIRSIFHQLQRMKEQQQQQQQKQPQEQQDQSEEAPGHVDVEDNGPATISPGTTYEYEVRVQFLEVYGEEIRDLLNPQQQATTTSGASKLSIRDVGDEEPEVVGATQHRVDSADEALLCLTRGMYRRVTGSTAMNESSSRSHAILSLVIEQSTVLSTTTTTSSSSSSSSSADADRPDFQLGNENGDDGLQSARPQQLPQQQPQQQQQHVQLKRSRFNFVDLAGSERQKRTQATGQRLKEGIDINKGLLVLGNVISALGDPKKQGKTFVPYRDSKLTRLLKGSLGGNHKTLMIACVSPSSSNMEETLNCLRYANRAKNIQNHAVVNLDATSQLVAELKLKIQRLAADLMKARTGKMSECSIPMDVIESLATGGDGGDSGEDYAMTTTAALSPSPYPSRSSMFATRSSPEIVSSSLTEHSELKAENEAYRLQFQALSNGQDPSDALQKAYVTKATEYERVIAHLKSQIMTISNGKRGPRSGRSDSRQEDSDQSSRYRSESPELSRLKVQIFGSLSQSSQLDAEVEAEEVAVKQLATKYLNHPAGADGGEFVEDETDHEHDAGTFRPDDFDTSKVELPEDLSIRLEADLFTLSTSINAKEELIHQLQAAQEKYESMREFYEDKLKEMSLALMEKEVETEKLSEELRKLGDGNSRSTELSERLKQKQEQVAELRRKQAELVRLTTVSSRNESQISKLRNEVSDMKQKKVDMQKQITNERKNHLLEVQKLKKESMQKERELNKAKRGLDQKTQEANMAQQIAKSRLDQMTQLKAKYRDTEKRLRMQTVKRGVMKKAGLDPVIVGRRQSKDTSKENNEPSKVGSIDDGVNFDNLRDFFDQKVADVGRRENLAEKLAQEWEEHLELTVQRDELLESDIGDRDTAVKSLESQIKYREERIRQLASRLGKREKPRDERPHGDDTFLFDQKFEQVVGKLSKTTSTTVAAKVLFGMVVRERRRIASLARTASSLDEKVREAEVAAEAKDAAFRAFVDEHRLEAAALAQSQQEHILSLMEMVKEPTDESNFSVEEPGPGPNQRGADVNASGKTKLLVLANERIAVLERQLNEAQLGRDAVREHREREEEALALLEEKNQECEDLEEEIDDLRTALRRIREEVARNNGELTSKGESGKYTPIKAVDEIVTGALHSSGASTSSKRRRSTISPKVLGHSPSLTPRIKRETQFMHSSDSDEIPDWAEDIMADLAIIAEGKIPSALLESQEVLVAESQLNHNVFDRLTDPESFTGVQKQRNSKSNRLGKSRSTSASNAVGQEHRRMISLQVADSLNKVIIPLERKKKKESAPRKPKEKLPPDAERRSVFDRLISPSNLTGTQKQKFHDNQGRTLEKAIETQRVSVSRGRSRLADYEADRSEGEEADFLLDNILMDENDQRLDLSSEIRSPPSKLDEYKRLDVFERLNKTTTQAYAVKQNANIAEKMLCDILDSSDQENDNELHHKSEPRFERVEEYASQDVFERLQRTTTEAYAKKTHSPLEDSVRPGAGTQSHVDSATPSRQRGERNQGSPPKNPPPVTSSPKYLDVFDRLQRKTTEAYAKKKNPPV